jgi:hypothetical protein
VVEGVAVAASRGEVEKEREEKDDGRYIIFYTFEDDETGKGPPDGGGRNG